MLHRSQPAPTQGTGRDTCGGAVWLQRNQLVCLPVVLMHALLYFCMTACEGLGCGGLQTLKVFWCKDQVVQGGITAWTWFVGINVSHTPHGKLIIKP